MRSNAFCGGRELNVGSVETLAENNFWPLMKNSVRPSRDQRGSSPPPVETVQLSGAVGVRERPHIDLVTPGLVRLIRQPMAVGR